MSTTQDGYTPLVTAAEHGKWDVVSELLDSGADINAQNNVSPTNTVIVYRIFIHHLKSVVTFGAVELFGCILIPQHVWRAKQAHLVIQLAWDFHMYVSDDAFGYMQM